MPAARPVIGFFVLASALSVLSCENLSGQPSPRQSEPDGLRLLHQMQNALGGAGRIAAIRDFEETIVAEAWDASGGPLGEVRKRTRWMRTPNVIRLDQRGPRGTYVLYFNGDSGSGWEMLPDLKSPDPYKTTGAAVTLAGGELQFAKGYLSGFELNLWLADRISGYGVTSSTPHVLRIEHGGETTDIALDPVTSLPVKSAGVSLADPSRPVPAEMHYEGWRELSGVRFSTRRVSYHGGVKRGEVRSVDIRVNAGLRLQDLAAKPADFAPEIPRR